jgi:signal peptidase II
MTDADGDAPGPVVEDSDGAEAAPDAPVEPVDPVATAKPIDRSRVGITVGIVLIVLGLDQLTKHWALNALSDGRSRHVIWTIDWNLTFNSGMAFSRAQGVGPYIGAVALIVIVVLLLSLRRNGSTLSTVAVGMVVGGALGNLADRLFRGKGWLRGEVVDFIDPRWWPIFNVADMGVTIGGILLVLVAVFDSRSPRRT